MGNKLNVLSVKEAITSRRSVRGYLKKEVPKRLLKIFLSYHNEHRKITTFNHGTFMLVRGNQKIDFYTKWLKVC
jgi:hypothetical protein